MNFDEIWQLLIASYPNGCELLIAYSGGMDSHVLLHLLANTAPGSFKLKAIHVHHGLNPSADEWVSHCKTICHALNIELVVEYVDAKPAVGESPEAAARQARYQAFALHLNNKTCLVTAHHSDDQAETVLLQLFRGAGVRGLSAMALLHDHHWRPFLLTSRDTLLAHAQHAELKWIEDSSNQNCDIARNFLRHEVIPKLKLHWPGLTKALGRSAQLQQEAECILSDIALDDFKMASGTIANTLSIPALKKLSSVRQANVLRFWLRHLNLPVPSKQKIQQIQNDVLNAGHDKMPLVIWQGVNIRCFRQDLYALPSQSPIPEPLSLIWPDPTQPLLLPNLGFLSVECLDFLPKMTQVEIRYPFAGLRVLLNKRNMRKDFKKCCQEWGVPPWLRNRIPLIYINNELALIECFAVIEGFAGLRLKLFLAEEKV